MICNVISDTSGELNMKTDNKGNFQPTIISTADSYHYIVLTCKVSDQQLGLREVTKSTLFLSLSEAKSYLRGLRFSKAILEYQSAYDEMCGLPCGSKVTEEISL